MSQTNFIHLLQDKDFKAEIFAAYEKSAIERRFQAHTIIEDLRDLFVTMCGQCNQAQSQGNGHLAFTAVPVNQIRNRILELAGVGLSLSPRKQEAYLNVRADDNNKPTVEIVFGIQGMSLMFGESPKIQAVSFNLVHEGDVFEWLGETQIPRYSHSYTTDGNPIVAAFSVIHLRDGGVLCTYISRHEIEVVAAEQIQNAQAWGGSTPWLTFAARCVRNMILRRTFKDRAHTLGLIPGTKRVDDTGRMVDAPTKESGTDTETVDAGASMPQISDDDFVALLQSSLENGTR